MNDICRSQETQDIDRKTRACSEGYKQLIERMVYMTKPPKEMRTESNLSNSADVNTVALPTDYIRYQSIWFLVNSNYEKFTDDEIVSLQELMEYANTNHYDTSNTGTPRMVAVDGDQLVFDKHFASAGTTNVKLSYYQYPTEITAYDQLSISFTATAFSDGETITGGTSGATATVVTSTTSLVDVESTSLNGSFQALEKVTGGTSGVEAIVTRIPPPYTEKVQVLELGEKYKLAIATAGAMMYLYMTGSVEASEKDNTLDNLIKQLAATNEQGNRVLRPNVR